MIQIINLNHSDTNLLSEICNNFNNKIIEPYNNFEYANSIDAETKNKEIAEIKSKLKATIIDYYGYETLNYDNGNEYIVQIYLIDNDCNIDNQIKLFQTHSESYKIKLSIIISTKLINIYEKIDTIICTNSVDIQRFVLSFLFIFPNYSTDISFRKIENITEILKNKIFKHNWTNFDKTNYKIRLVDFKNSNNCGNTAVLLFLGLSFGDTIIDYCIELFLKGKNSKNALIKVLKYYDIELHTLTIKNVMNKIEFTDLINNFNGKPLNESYIDYAISKNVPAEFVELLKSNDLLQRNSIWSKIQNQIKPNDFANPYFIGSGNPNSNILIIGKELGFNSENLIQFYNESIQNVFHWEQVLANNYSIDFSPEKPYDIKKIKLSSGHTWRKYDKLVRKLMKAENDNDFSFLSHCFLTEYNFVPSPKSQGKANLIDVRKNLLEHPFYKTFNIIINSARAYDEGYMDKMFNVNWIKTERFQNSKRSFLLYENQQEQRKLILIDQLSGAWSDDILNQICELVTN